MSLSNPSSVVTEERLAQFYQGIYPYLGSGGGGGSDYPILYDENDVEHQVGWYYTSQNTKKPIYQKKLTFSANEGSRYWKDIGTISNVDKCLNMYGLYGNYVIGGYWGSSAGDYCALIKEQDNNNVLTIKMVINGMVTGDGFVIVQYTKTTDTAITPEIEYPVKYSTTEQIVGQWIDGKPLYQITVNYDNLNITTSWNTTPLNILNHDKVWISEGYYQVGNEWFPLNYSNNGYEVIIELDTTSGVALAYKGGNSRTGNLMVTVKYTKTTD